MHLIRSASTGHLLRGVGGHLVNGGCCLCKDGKVPTTLTVTLSGLLSCPGQTYAPGILQYFPATIPKTLNPHPNCHTYREACLWGYMLDFRLHGLPGTCGLNIYRDGTKWIIDTCVGGSGWASSVWFYAEYDAEDCCQPFTVDNWVTAGDCGAPYCCPAHYYRWPVGYGGTMTVTPNCPA